MCGPTPKWGRHRGWARTRTPFPPDPFGWRQRVDVAVQHWLLAQLGPSTDLADLNTRYTRLGTARAVAIEVLRERYAALRDQPTAVTVTNVVAINVTANLAAYERQIAALEAGEPPAPDDPPGGGPDTIGILCLEARPRR